MKKNLGFSDFAMASSLKPNPSLKLMEKLNSPLNRTRIESTSLSHYSVGASGECVDAYLPLFAEK
jgi:hypothetical protein